jgi:hypothetical protein
MKNNFLFIVFDSCRFDSFAKARAPNILRLGALERRYSYASWTVPAHAVYLMGVSPHANPRGVFASEVYKADFANWSQRLDIPDVSFRGFMPQLSLPYFLKQQGYTTNALVSLPALNQTTVLNAHFDRYALMKDHNDFDAMIDALKFDPDQPSFYLLNIGETHYPYTLAGEEAVDLPTIHGVHGVLKHMGDTIDSTGENIESPEEFFDMNRMRDLHEKQRSNVERLDALFEKLYDCCPPNTYFLVTSDHGELFGENGFFGHGPVFHEKVFEVFFVEGLRK